jgi:SecD/SecF fusion protein
MSRGLMRPFLLLTGTCLCLPLTGCFQQPPDHGTALLLEADTTGFHSDNERKIVLDAVSDMVVKRAERFGSRYSVAAAGTNRTLLKVQTLAEKDLASFRRMLLRGGVLEFCLVEPRGSTLLLAEATGSEHRNVILKRKLPDGRTVEESYSLKRPPEMVGGVKTAMVMRDSRGQPEIAFTLDAEGARRFAQVTRDNIGRQLAIVVDGELQTAPVIRSPIEGGSGVISGSFDEREAFELAGVLEAPLPVPVRIVKEEAF